MGAKVVFVGYAVSPGKCFATPGASPAANRYQLGLLGGIHRLINSDLSVITRLPISPANISYFYFVRQERHELFPGLSTTILPMLNLPFLKQLWSALAALAEIGRWGWRVQQSPIRVVVGYNLNSLLGVAATLASAMTKSYFIYIFTDPPYHNVKKGLVWRVAYSLNSSLTRFAIRRSTGVVTVNAGAVEVFAPGKPFSVIEGGVEVEENETAAERSVNAKTLVYSGGLSPHNGLEALIDGFLLTRDPEYRLCIYGRGILDKSLKERATRDGRIVFPGFVPVSQMAEIQRRAAVLINPRPAQLDICKTTFPSKLMEYLASGRPVITTRLQGITPDYGPYFHFVDDESPQGFAEAIDRLLGMPEEQLARMGGESRRFVLRQKNWDRQAEAFLRFVNEIAGVEVK